MCCVSAFDNSLMWNIRVKVNTGVIVTCLEAAESWFSHSIFGVLEQRCLVFIFLMDKLREPIDYEVVHHLAARAGNVRGCCASPSCRLQQVHSNLLHVSGYPVRLYSNFKF